MQTARLRQLGIAAALAAALVIAVVLLSQSGSDDGAGVASDETATVEELFAGIPQGGTTLGDPDAPARMIEFADLQCPFCRDFAVDVLPELIDRYVRGGELQLTLELLSILGEDSAEAARVAAAAALQDRMWEFVDVFYRNQGEEGSGYVTEDFLREIAAATPGLDADAALSDADSPQAGRIVQRALEQAGRLGIDSTPSFLIAERGGTPREVRVESLEVETFADPIESAIGG